MEVSALYDSSYDVGDTLAKHLCAPEGIHSFPTHPFSAGHSVSFHKHPRLTA